MPSLFRPSGRYITYSLLSIVTIYLVLHIRQQRFASLEIWEHLHTSSTSFYASVDSGFEVAGVNPVFKGESIAKVCSQRTWTPGLVFTCRRLRGSVAVVRNQILSCVRYAIEAGAALEVPRVMVSENSNATASLDHLFDQEYFVSILIEACPQLHIIEQLDELENIAAAKLQIELAPETLLTPSPNEIPPGKITTWHIDFEAWLQLQPKFDAGNPLIVNLELFAWQYFINDDSPEFILNFGHILRFSTDLRSLAAIVLLELASQHEVDFGFDNKEGLKTNGSFFGVHLPLSADLLDDSPEVAVDPMATTARFFAAAVRYHAKLIYISSVDNSSIKSFKDEAASTYNITVVSKYDLLRGTNEGQDVKVLEALTADQQTAVDWLVLERAGFVVGVDNDAFACNVVLRRHYFGFGRPIDTGEEEEQQMEQEKSKAKGLEDLPSGFDGDEAFEDQWNMLFGKKDLSLTFERIWP